MSAGARAVDAPIRVDAAAGQVPRARSRRSPDGVWPATAQKIFDWRTAGFGSVDDLDLVPGIGSKRLAAFRVVAGQPICELDN